MIVNRKGLLSARPIVAMETEKQTHRGTSYGLSEAGYDIRIKEDIYLAHGENFKLASAMELFDMPNNLVGIVHDKSTWARQGLSVFNTVIEPGWRGYLTLELVFHGQGHLLIHAGQGIAQVLFHEITEDVTYQGKYQDQETGPQEARN